MKKNRNKRTPAKKVDGKKLSRITVYKDGVLKQKSPKNLTLVQYGNLKINIANTVIIGGGPAGSYTALRLKQSDSNGTKEIILYEMSSRAGGRLASYTFTKAPSISVELGAMRYKSSDLTIINLIKVFGLRVKPFQYNTKIYLLKNTAVREEELGTVGADLYNLKGIERDTPENLIKLAIKENLDITEFPVSAEENTAFFKMLMNKIFHGLPLYRTGWINFLQEALSPQAISFIKDTDGYNSNHENMPTEDALREHFLFSDSYSAIIGGYARLVETMHAEFLKAGGKANFNYELLEFKKLKQSGNNELHRAIMKQLAKENITPPELILKFKNHLTDAIEYTVTDSLVLAIPKNAIEKLNQLTRFFDPSKGSHVQSSVKGVESLHSLKIYLEFPYNWWGKYGLDKSRVISDGPIRMMYTVGVENQENISSPQNDTSVLLLYVDQVAAREYPVSPDEMKTPDEQTSDKHRQLIEFAYHQVVSLMKTSFDPNIKIPYPTNLAFRYWSEAYHCFAKGVNSDELKMDMLKPNPNFNVFVVGSAYSSQQSWAEGAFLTAEYVVQKYFGLSKPAWLPEHYVTEQLFHEKLII